MEEEVDDQQDDHDRDDEDDDEEEEEEGEPGGLAPRADTLEPRTPHLSPSMQVNQRFDKDPTLEETGVCCSCYLKSAFLYFANHFSQDK